MSATEETAVVNDEEKSVPEDTTLVVNSEQNESKLNVGEKEEKSNISDSSLIVHDSEDCDFKAETHDQNAEVQKSETSSSEEQEPNVVEQPPIRPDFGDENDVSRRSADDRFRQMQKAEWNMKSAQINGNGEENDVHGENEPAVQKSLWDDDDEEEARLVHQNSWNEERQPVQENPWNVKNGSAVKEDLWGSENESTVQENSWNVKNGSAVNNDLWGSENESAVKEELWGSENEPVVKKDLWGSENGSVVQENQWTKNGKARSVAGSNSIPDVKRRSRPGQNFRANQEPQPSHEPNFRTTTQIFQDDAKKNCVRTLYDTDGGILVENGPDDMMVFDTWEEADFSKQIIDNIRRSGYDRPRNFQRYAMPMILNGYDLKGQAETGSGKSAGFLLPVIQRLSLQFAGKKGVDRHCEVSALIIVPTRELAVQLMEQATKFADGTGVTVNCAYGKYKETSNKQNIHMNGCDILVGTIGRLRSFIQDKFVKVDKLKYFIMDEADMLLNETFMEDIQTLTNLEDFPTIEKRQTLFFSATFKSDVRYLADKYCKKNTALIRNKAYDINKRIMQEVLEVPFAERTRFLVDFLKNELKKNDGHLSKTLIFVEKKVDADAIAEEIRALGIPIQAVHGERTQQEREEVNRAFRDGHIRALIVTNLFSRGLDILELAHVINLHMPGDRNTYVHRIGRTGRSEEGFATTCFDPNHEPDREMAKTIFEEMMKSRQPIPQFLRDVVNDLNNNE